MNGFDRRWLGGAPDRRPAMPSRDAFKLLSALGAHPALLDEIAEDALRAAHMLIRRQLKSPNLTVEHLRALHDGLGGAALSASVAGLSRTAAGEIVKRLDRRNPHAKGPAHGLDDNWARARILALASGAARPSRDRAAAASWGEGASNGPASAEAIALALREARAPEPRRETPAPEPRSLKSA